MLNKIDIAVIGASTSVGETLLEILEERKFPLGELYLLDSEVTAGGRLDFNGQALKVGDINVFDFSKVTIAFFVSTEAVSKEYAPRAVEKDCIVIDRSPAFRNEKDVPLVIPEVNADAIADYKNRNIISSPCCTTIEMLVALKPVYDDVGIARINVSTYQAVSGSGKDAAEELAAQTAALLNFRDVKCKTYPKQIAFNVLPQVGDFQNNGYTDEEMKIVHETQKVLDDNSIAINATAVRVPVFIGHAATVNIETRDKISANKVRELLLKQDGVELMDGNQAGGVANWPTPVTEAAGNDKILVGRVREDISSENGLNFWIVTDNMRKGAALNTVQIAEILVKLYL